MFVILHFLFAVVAVVVAIVVVVVVDAVVFGVAAVQVLDSFFIRPYQCTAYSYCRQLL